jgi:RNA polymerase sigma-70 factor (ECF subfamily)
MTDERSDRWLSAFHAGERWALEECYREHASKVAAAARRLLGGVDAETILHDVFYRLLSSAKMRASFQGGNIGAWLTQVATRSAIDDLRRRRRETSPLEEDGREIESVAREGERRDADEELEAKMLVERFRKERLPPEWESLFDARFLRQLPQRDAARELGIPRSTLVYQEQRIRALLQRFLLVEQDDSSRPEPES